MKTLTIDQTQLVKAIAQLTHEEVDPAQWPWVVTFDPDEDAPSAQVRLPDRMDTQGGFHTLRREGAPDQPESDAGLPDPVVASPLDFAELATDTRWSGELPDFSQPTAWPPGALQTLLDKIGAKLREQVTIEGERYRVEYQ